MIILTHWKGFSTHTLILFRAIPKTLWSYVTVAYAFISGKLKRMSVKM